MKQNSGLIPDSADSQQQDSLIEKVKSQENIQINPAYVLNNSVDVPQSEVLTPDRLKERHSRISSVKSGKESKQRYAIKPERVLKAIEPSEFIIKGGSNEVSSPSKRLLEHKKSRVKLNQSKEMTKNESQSKLAVIKQNYKDLPKEIFN